ncbi:hypothetical protein OROGR_028231 [Orobanche gracilis]
MVKTVSGKSEVTTTQLEEAYDQLPCPAHATFFAIIRGPTTLAKHVYDNRQYCGCLGYFLSFLNCCSSSIWTISPSLLVRLGNEFVRSYYKCTHPNCQAKKQLQQLNNGDITDSICIGQHNHPRPQSNTVQPVPCVLPVGEQPPQKPSLANVEDKSSVEHGCMPQEIKPLRSLPPSISPADESKAADLQLKVKDDVQINEVSESKRLKKDNGNAAATGVDTSNWGYRVVQTSSEVDFVNDGYRWCKYGQKLVKGNANPRSYYRCSSPGCGVKKHVERSSQDSKIVITTYEEQHDHEIPLGRTSTHSAPTDTRTMATNGKPGTKYESAIVCVDTSSKSMLDEQLKEESITKSVVSDMVEFHVISLGNEVPESKLEEPEGSKDCLNMVAVHVHDTPSAES